MIGRPASLGKLQEAWPRTSDGLLALWTVPTSHEKCVASDSVHFFFLPIFSIFVTETPLRKGPPST